MKRFFSLSLAILFIIAAIPLGTVKASAETPTGTPLGTPEELIELMGDSTKWAQDYYLTADIDLTGIPGQKPIGTGSSAYFAGNFNGCGYTISGLNLSGTSYIGLFGYIDGTAARRTVSNLTIADSTFTCTGGSAGVGAVAAVVKGNVDFTGCRIESTVTVSMTGAQDGAGGICGYFYPSPGCVAYITDCVNEGTINGARSMVGRIVGFMKNDSTSIGVIRNCVNNGSINASTGHAGGIVGYYRAHSSSADYYIEVKDCINTGTITAPSYLGGIGGYGFTYTAPPVGVSTIRVTGNFNSGTVNGGMASANKYAGGISGVCQRQAIISNNVNVGAVTCYTYVGGVIGGMDNVAASGVAFLTYNVNLGTLTCDANGEKYGTVGWDKTGTTKASSDYTTKNYYLSEYGSDTSIAVAPEDIDDAASFDSLDFDSIWFMTANGPRLIRLVRTELVGTAIRTTGNQGLRFKAALPYAVNIGSSVGKEGYEVREYGLLVKLASNGNALSYFPTTEYDNNYNADSIGKGVAYCAADSIDHRFSDNGITVQFTSVLINIDEANYETEFSFCSYIVLNDGVNDIVIYSAPNTTSIYYVAARILEEEYGGVLANAPVYIQQIINAHTD